MSLFDRLVKPGIVIVAELVDSIRAKRNPSITSSSNMFPSGLTGYIPGFSGQPEGLNPAGFYEIKSINVGIMDTETMTNLVRNSASDSNFDSFENIAVASLDSLFVPYSVDVDHTYLPHFESPTTDNKPNSNTLNPFNPDNSLASGVTSSSGLPAGIEGRWLKYGHNINLATSDSGITDLSFEKDYWNTASVNYDKVRAVAFRNPMILSGWGYSTSGLPVPASGEEFDARAFYDPSLWKTGPLDVRWEDSRKVWMPKPYYKIRFQIRESDCETSSAVVKILSRSEGVSSVPEEYEIEDTGISQCYSEQNETGDTVCSKFVEVYDKLGAFLNESNINLVGRLGYAEYLYGQPYVDTQPWLCWEITGLAEQQTECETA